MHAERDPDPRAVRLGVPPNLNALLPGQTAAPLPGTVWDPRIDHGQFATGATLDVLAVNPNGAQLNVPLAVGTLLCDPGAPAQLLVVSAGSPFKVAIPYHCNLIGHVVSCQGQASADRTDCS